MNINLGTKGINKIAVFGFLFGLVSILIRILVPADLIQTAYTEGLYPFLRSGLDRVHAFFGIHLFWPLLITLILILSYSVFRIIRVENPPQKKLLKIGLGTVAFLIGMAGIFLWLWGYNYGKKSFYENIGLEPIDLSIEEMKGMVADQIQLLDSLHEFRNSNPDYELAELGKHEFFKPQLKEVLFDIGMNHPGNPEPVAMRPKGFLLRLGTAGFYNPFTGESNVDPGLHPLQIPFVTVHELSHAYGITHEGACNFLAVLVGRSVQDPGLRYPFELTYYRYLMGQLRSMDLKAYEMLRKEVPEQVREDLAAIRLNGQNYPDLFPKLRDLIYGSYLKSQGQTEGLGSYNKVVNMVAAWDKKSLLEN
ncbi:MAG: DUF3810 family protein [Saprospiraceae bacterium]|nr:DUF3810 family protein [Saprospiraceae bacterium]